MRDLYSELAEYVGRPRELVRARCQHASVELAWQFEKDKDDPIRHYRDSDLYVFALTRYQTELQEKYIHSWYQQMIKQRKMKTGLDFGGGIGEQTILGFEAGVERMGFVEVLSSETYQYAEWRFKKHEVNPTYLNEESVINSDFDFVVAMDVFEHMENPQPVIENIARHTRYLFCNPNEILYTLLYPQHISQYSLKSFFMPLEIYLYESLL
jgi:2-polyprenyl-3-methyl-5-hydroxy-6-metoxy-1,4-benzoquinol methylase